MFDELNEDLKGKVKECKTAEELAALAETEGFELSNEMLDAVSGGVTDEVCISLESCASYCQIYNYEGMGRKGDHAWSCTWVCGGELPQNCMEVTGV